MPKINSLEVVHQDTNKDGFDNLHDLLVSLKGSANKEVIDGQARAAYETLLEMYDNDKEAFARRLETLTAEFGTSIAQVLEEWTVYASATEAYAKKIEEVSAKAFQNEAKVTEEMYARVTADEAVAKLVTTLRADFESAQAKSRASIKEEQIVRANASEALASRSSVLEARLDTGDFATVKTLAEAGAVKNKTYRQTSAPINDPVGTLQIGDIWFDTDASNKTYRWDGFSWVETTDTRIATTYARWGVQVDANGNVAGIQLNADSTGTSEFTIVANNFKIYGSGGQESIHRPLDVTVAGSTQRVGIGNAMIVYYEGAEINRWAAINNIKTSGIYSRPTAPAIVDLPYSWAYNGPAGFFAGNVGTGGNYHGSRGVTFNNNNPASVASSGIVGSHTGAAFYAEVGSYAPFTGEHQSVINKDYPIQEGQIVVDKEIVMKKDISNTLSRVEKSNTINQKGVIGVFTSNIGPMSKVSTLSVISEHRVDDGFGNLTGPLTEQYDQIKDLYDVVSINALGEGQILVCGENGSISIGDLIVTSSVEGVGMKQADDIIRSYTVAKAREDITFNDTTTSKLISCIYLCG